jgi:hypothetical protein
MGAGSERRSAMGSSVRSHTYRRAIAADEHNLLRTRSRAGSMSVNVFSSAMLTAGGSRPTIAVMDVSNHSHGLFVRDPPRSTLIRNQRNVTAASTVSVSASRASRAEHQYLRTSSDMRCRQDSRIIEQRTIQLPRRVTHMLEREPSQAEEKPALFSMDIAIREGAAAYATWFSSEPI